MTLLATAVLVLGGTVSAQDTSKPPGIRSLWKMGDSLSRTETRNIGQSAIATYLYIEEYEVRHEVMIPLYLMEDWVGFEYGDASSIDTAEQRAILPIMEEFLSGRNPLSIDGIEVQPIVYRVEFVDPVSIASIQDTVTPGPIDLYTSWIGIILIHETKGIPGTVEIAWDMLNASMTDIKSLVFAFDQAIEIQFSADSAVYRWDNPGIEPTPPINEIEAEGRSWWKFWGGGISDKSAGKIHETLLRNVYRAFDYRSESDVYDALARSVGGELLDEIYLQIRKSLAMQEQGGAISRIRKVEIVEGRVKDSDDDSFRYAGNWIVEGTVEHWGHIHARTNGYSAEFSIREIEGAWKIVDLQVTKQERLKFESTLRQ